MTYLRNKGQGAMEYLMTYGWAILVVMIVGVVLWQLGVFSSGTKNIVTTGFAKVQPIVPAIVYKNDSFDASFVNSAGSAILLNNVSLQETFSGESCNSPTSPSLGQSVTGGNSFTLSSDDCPSKSDGEAYDMLVTINYTSTVGGITTEHVDTGHIRGVGEAF